MDFNFKNKKIAVLGAGVEGVSSALYLSKIGAKITVLDKSNKIDQNIDLKLKNERITIRTGDDYLGDLSSFDMIVRSPGIKLNIDPLNEAKKKGIIITSQTKLFLDLCKAPIIGVTGTKGKGTTSALIYEILKKDGRDVYLGGNIGMPPFDFLDKLNPSSWVVLEMSSFQLQDLEKSPHIAVVLMITSDHMAGFGDRNHHDTQEEYVAAKRNILNFQTESDFAVINRDYPASNESDIHTKGKVYFVSREKEVGEGCFALGGQIILRANGKETPLIDTKELLLRGEHNQENVCAASMAAYLAGTSYDSIRAVLKTFKGLEHRLELVDTINGVSYYDDSFSVNPYAAIAAIQSFKEPEILILGGSSKKADFEELGKIISERKNIKAIIGIGEEWPRIKSKIKNQKSNLILIENAKDMNTIVATAAKIAVPGDVVLLSPACASFDMFQNYKDRGNQFKEEVKKLSGRQKSSIKNQDGQG